MTDDPKSDGRSVVFVQRRRYRAQLTEHSGRPAVLVGPTGRPGVKVVDRDLVLSVALFLGEHPRNATALLEEPGMRELFRAALRELDGEAA